MRCLLQPNASLARCASALLARGSRCIRQESSVMGNLLVKVLMFDTHIHTHSFHYISPSEPRLPLLE